MFMSVNSAFIMGVEGIGVEVEVDLSPGLPQTILVGLPDSTIRESVERVRTAIKNVGYRFPLERITINLSPADMKKEGTGFDLAIAIAILQASKQLNHLTLGKTLIVGELALSGEVKPARGILAILEYAKRKGYTHVVLPHANLDEASLISDLYIASLSHLSELTELRFNLSQTLTKPVTPQILCLDYGDIVDIIDQHSAKRALLVAAAGKHNIAVMGPPGIGKTMLIRRLPTILPSLEEVEAIEVTKINSLASNLNHYSLIQTPPFRQPHHTISSAGLIGGGNPARPGEISLSHHGVLFLDEFTEFPRHIIELLRQPIEERKVTIARARAKYQFPSHFMLAVSFNPCPCGLFGYDLHDQQCKCSTLTIQKYRSKLSGPILDRIDLQIAMSRPPLSQQKQSTQNELNSAQLRDKVIQARQIQLERNTQYGISFNSDLSGQHLKLLCRLSKEANELLKLAYEKLNMSYRGYDKLIKIARTIADLDQSELIDLTHMSEAISYRNGELSY